MNIKAYLTGFFLAMVTTTDGYWTTSFRRRFCPSFLTTEGKLRMTFDGGNELSQSIELESGDDPCWQNMLDDDCSMGNIYSANFVASKWIQSMPCGEGIEDCDMPTALTSPHSRPEAGVHQVDVMEFLGLKRVDSLNNKMP